MDGHCDSMKESAKGRRADSLKKETATIYSCVQNSNNNVLSEYIMMMMMKMTVTMTTKTMVATTTRMNGGKVFFKFTSIITKW